MIAMFEFKSKRTLHTAYGQNAASCDSLNHMLFSGKVGPKCQMLNAYFNNNIHHENNNYLSIY